jgi:hypothetical protein
LETRAGIEPANKGLQTFTDEGQIPTPYSVRTIREDGRNVARQRSKADCQLSVGEGVMPPP